MIRSLTRIFFAEWRKLRRPTLLLGTMGAVAFFSVLVSSLLFLLIDSPQGNGDRGVRITREMLALHAKSPHCTRNARDAREMPQHLHTYKVTSTKG